ncbi:helix-turn-helix domain-containing protein [Nocardia salmonicida]|uniref:helix-turn-helix domain-containing protein n=1 Tax=Nocardia salmonicida TaxID=53431 RepID=UPI0033FB3A0B
MHEFRRYIEAEMASRGWKQADLVRASGLSRSHVSKLLRDDRDRLGQMPDETTLEAIAGAFGVSMEIPRTAASRALAGYADDGIPLQVDLRSVPTDLLVREIQRRAAAAETLLAQMIATVRYGKLDGLDFDDVDLMWNPAISTGLRDLASELHEGVAPVEAVDASGQGSQSSGEPIRGVVNSLLASGRREWEPRVQSCQRRT